MRALNDDDDVAQRGGHTPANRSTEACRFGFHVMFSGPTGF